jgi:hypothetical protein
MKAKSETARLNLPASAAGTCHMRRRPAKPASQNSESLLERMFLAELAARRARLKKWLCLVE